MNTHNGDRKCMLVVDDVEMDRALLKKMFQSEYDILEAANGKEALAQLKLHPEIFIVLLDIVMPELDGLGVLQAMREDPKLVGIPVILATQHDEIPLQVQALKKGASDFVVKPYHPDIMRCRVANVVSRLLLLQMQAKVDTAVPAFANLLPSGSSVTLSKILLIDHDSEDRFRILRLLNQHLVPDEAISGTQALEKLSKETFAAILLNMALPDEEAFTFLRLRHKSTLLASIPVLAFCSTESIEGTEKKALQLGATDFIRNPYEGLAVHKRLMNLILLTQK